MQASAEKAGEMVEKRIPCEVYSRVIGYLRPVQNWNKGMRQMERDRKYYNNPSKRRLEAMAPKG